ncbi:hypothetical protein KKG72_04785 [bacterium]|nr:hypothetical protein [bacterium]MBU1995488.1 hypothetical protein [bacterium]
MKSFFATFTFLFLLSGCSHQNAFTKFNMNIQQELASSSIQSSKIKNGTKVNGIFSAIYLNEVYPDAYNQHEYFFVYLYLKDKQEMYDPNSFEDVKLALKLNGKLPIKIKQLPHANKFSHLASVESEWNRYYIVAFKESSKKLSLVLESGQSSSVALIYQKDEQ